MDEREREIDESMMRETDNGNEKETDGRGGEAAGQREGSANQNERSAGQGDGSAGQEFKELEGRDESDDADRMTAGDEEKDNKRDHKRKDRKDKKDKKDEKIAELEDRVKRQMAEFDNFRKRSEKEKSLMYEIGAKSVVEKILPVVDNFERGLQTIPEEEKGKPFAEGMSMIYKQLMTGLEELGVKPIEAVGQEFNPDIHNAVMHVEDEELGENIVTEELQKGYMYRETVVRHSMVKVAN